jgi:hypothetical protein
MQSACAVLILSSVASPAVLHFSLLSQKRQKFSEKFVGHKIVLWFSEQLLSEIFLILRRTQRDAVINVHRSLCTVPIIVVGFL